VKSGGNGNVGSVGVHSRNVQKPADLNTKNVRQNNHKTLYSFEERKEVRMAKRRLKTLNDLRRYVASVITRLEDGQLDPGIAGRLGFLANILRAVIEKSELENRVSALEKQIGDSK
jgi:hypothetical protein